jgi:hypothetical protein
MAYNIVYDILCDIVYDILSNQDYTISYNIIRYRI